MKNCKFCGRPTDEKHDSHITCVIKDHESRIETLEGKRKPV